MRYSYLVTRRIRKKNENEKEQEQEQEQADKKMNKKTGRIT